MPVPQTARPYRKEWYKGRESELFLRRPLSPSPTPSWDSAVWLNLEEKDIPAQKSQQFTLRPRKPEAAESGGQPGNKKCKQAPVMPPSNATEEEEKAIQETDRLARLLIELEQFSKKRRNGELELPEGVSDREVLRRAQVLELIKFNINELQKMMG